MIEEKMVKVVLTMERRAELGDTLSEEIREYNRLEVLKKEMAATQATAMKVRRKRANEISEVFDRGFEMLTETEAMMRREFEKEERT